MFNLIRRDIILQKRQLLLYIPFLIFFIVMDSHPALIYLVTSIFIPFNTYYYDEKAETNILLNSLPYTRKEIIAARYLGAIVYMGVAIVITSVALLVFQVPFTVTDIAIGGGLFLLFSAVAFPVFHIFKPGYIFSAVLIGFLVSAAIGPAIVIYLAERWTTITNFIMTLSTPVLYTGASLIVITIYGISWVMTTIIYMRKAF